MTPYRYLCSLSVLAVFLAGGCLPSGGGGGGGGGGGLQPPVPSGPPSEAENRLNALFQEQFGGTQAGTDRDIDDTIEVTSGGNSNQRMPIGDGQVVNIGLNYESDAPVDAICIGFGSPDNAWCVPADSANVDAQGNPNSGSLLAGIEIPPDLCDQLGQICHDIRCYEFAKTSAGTFSAENVNMIAMACGGCDEPSCQSLLDECTAPTPQPTNNGGTGSCGGSCTSGQCSFLQAFCDKNEQCLASSPDQAYNPNCFSDAISQGACDQMGSATESQMEACASAVSTETCEYDAEGYWSPQTVLDNPSCNSIN
jgi:hypothetical protein